MNEVEKSERGFGGSADEDEVEGCVVSVSDIRRFVRIVRRVGRCCGGGWRSEERWQTRSFNIRIANDVYEKAERL